MGSYWLHDAVNPLSAALGSKFNLYKGYETRSRSSGGFDGIWGILMHHDASSTTSSLSSVLAYEYENADDKPIGNFHVGRDASVWFGAAGASNHAGKGGSVPTSRGTIPKDAGNKYLIGIEAGNNGVGEVWNDAQMESYLTLVTVLCQTYKLDPLKDIYGHWTWCQPSCPGRKIDPAGPTPKYPSFGGTTGKASWNMDAVRKEVNARVNVKPPAPPTTDWRTLGRSYTTPPASMTYTHIEDNVTWLQAVLCSLDTEDGRPYYNPEWVGHDSIGGKEKPLLYGDATKNAVMYLQEVTGLTRDGQYGTKTAEQLYTIRGNR